MVMHLIRSQHLMAKGRNLGGEHWSKPVQAGHLQQRGGRGEDGFINRRDNLVINDYFQARDCLSCWCSGRADSCQSADLKLSIMPPPQVILPLRWPCSR